MSTSSSLESADLRRLLRKHFLGAALSLVAIVAIAVVLTLRYRTELDAFTVSVFASIGLSGLIAILFVTDWFVSPFPPDSVLILIAASPYHEHWPILLPFLGTVSATAGCLGYSCGRIVSRRAWAQRWFGNFHSKSQDMVLKYGPWSVAIGALTPVPFSITCWTAGLLRLPFRSFIFPCFLRIPRYVAYYAAIAYFPRLFQ
jgi:membrane protein YqaA with SNARE-associated domain